MTEKYFEINKNGHKIRCKLCYREQSPIERVVLFGHGFAGHKDNGAAQKFAERLCMKRGGIAVFLFDLPCHGDDEKKTLVLQDCMTYLSIVLDTVRTEFHADRIDSYATSFGGYLILKYIREYGNPFERIALRCPAVNMAEVLSSTIMKPDELDRLRRGEKVQAGFDRKIEIDLPLLMEMEASNLQNQDFSAYAKDILILHGTRDEVVPFESGKQFADKNRIAFIPVEKADHRFRDPACMELATEKVLAFLGL